MQSTIFRLIEWEHHHFFHNVIQDMLQFLLCSASLVDYHRELLVKGFQISPQKAPFITRIYSKNKNIGFCGGSLIADKFVLTAAHCLINTSASDIFVGTYHNVIYAYDDIDQNSDVIDVKNIWLDSRYNDDNIALGNDAALLELSRPPVNYGLPNGPQSVALTDSSFWYLNTNPVDAAFVIGYGAQSYGGPQSYYLQAAHVHLYTRNECYQKMGNIILSNSNLCASLDGADSCSGDSGGPLIVAHNSSFYHVGIVSFGLADRECGDADNPGVYSLTSFTQSFVQDIIPDIKYESFVELTGPDPCSCTSVETGCTSNGFDVSTRCGCADHAGDGIAFCYVQFETCSISSHSTYFFGASYRFCDLTNPNVLPPFPPSPVPVACDNICSYANDNDCDDGGLGSEFSECEFGTDCEDCGSRTVLLEPPPPVLMPNAPSPIPPPPKPNPPPSPNPNPPPSPNPNPPPSPNPNPPPSASPNPPPSASPNPPPSPNPNPPPSASPNPSPSASPNPPPCPPPSLPQSSPHPNPPFPPKIPPYNPCFEKNCGQTCTLCNPQNNDCVETQVVKVCDKNGQCGISENVNCLSSTESGSPNHPPPFFPESILLSPSSSPPLPLSPNDIIKSLINLKIIVEGSLDTFDKKTFERLIKQKFSRAYDIEFSYVSASVLVNITLVYDDFKIAQNVSSELQNVDLSSIKEDWLNGTFAVTSFSSASVEIIDEKSFNRSLIWQIGLVVVSFFVIYLLLRFCEKRNQKAVIIDTLRKNLRTSNVL